MSNYRVAVIRGGPSAEHEVSMKSGAAVLEALPQKYFTPLDIIISKGGEWLFNGRRYAPEDLLGHVDVVFNALHGTYGEDGALGRLLERHGVPYTGSDAFSSGVAMHKGIAKEKLHGTNILVAPHRVVTRDMAHDVHTLATGIGRMFGPQYVVKPAASGSSVGVTIVENPDLLARALESALQEYDAVLVEKRVVGREATCGIVEDLRDEQHYALPPVEIIHPTESPFFDYDAKYSGKSQEICPGNFSESEKWTLMEAARQVHDILGLRHYSRSDFIVADDGIYFLEVNTLPGLTAESLFPKALNAVGTMFEDFLTHILLKALRHE